MVKGLPSDNQISINDVCQFFCQWLQKHLNLEVSPGFEIEYARIVRTYIQQSTNLLMYNMIIKCRTAEIADKIIKTCEQKVDTSLVIEKYLSVRALRKRKRILMNTAKTLRLFGHKYQFNSDMSGIFIDNVLFKYEDGRFVS